MKKYLYLLAVILCAFELSGCATAASPNQMAFNYSGNQKPQSLALTNGITVNQVTGGHETNPLWTSQISHEDFKSALEQSLQSAGLYNQFANGNYILNADLVKLHQPFAGFNLTVTCEAHYVLQNAKTNKEIYNKDIVTSYTAKVSSSFLAVKRLELANEGAARANIQQLIEDLYNLPKA